MLRDFEINRDYGVLKIEFDDFKYNEKCIDFAYKKSGLSNNYDEEFEAYIEENWEDIVNEMEDEILVEEFYPYGVEGFKQDIETRDYIDHFYHRY